MKAIRESTENIRTFIIEQVKNGTEQLSKAISDEFGITRQSANKHIKSLIENNTLIKQGAGRGVRYSLSQQTVKQFTYKLTEDLDEYIVWLDDIKPHMKDLPKNLIEIWEYGVTEIVNNAKDHSDGDTLTLNLIKRATDTTVMLADNGVGIFKKIQEVLSLPDQRQAVLELAKGKLTTDPENHTGEGIFFSSRMFDDFWILSNDIAFSHQYGQPEDWIMENQRPTNSTLVIMALSNNSSRTCKKVFEEFAPAHEYAFTKTIVPLRMASFGTDRLISRSQAKRVLSNLEKFHTIIFDFSGVEAIGQGFADEIFRVYKNKHPHIELLDVNANQEVRQMILRVMKTSQMA